MGEYPECFNIKKPIAFRWSSTALKVLRTNFWYYPWLFKGGPLRTKGVAIFTSATWGRIASGKFGNINVLEDLYDTRTREPKDFDELGLSKNNKHKLRETVNTLYRGIPQA